ncbi:NAD(P)-binding protein [Lentinus brumalis]|uniref:NAD(P)-binding protein n=1 Tax=Lentinus brumalis TaxID=2498619 RepID=A0A371CV22_9APHY|nr:NAD(P)-binding protein [Polyporus brumalis]
MSRGTAESTKCAAIITGAAEGIGRGIALRLAKDGWDLGLFDLPRAEARLQEHAETLEKEYGTKITTVYGDVSKEDDVKRLVETVVQEHENLYAMIADAGSAIASYTEKIYVRARGLSSYEYAAIQIIKQGTGWRIFGAASVASKTGKPRTILLTCFEHVLTCCDWLTGIALHSVYCATKFAARGLTQSAAMDYGKYGIPVNAYDPGVVETPLFHELDEYHSKQNGQPRGTWINAFTNVLGRNEQPEDVAKLVTFLVSDDAAFITGEWSREIAVATVLIELGTPLKGNW